jgi:ADP-ribose pyrophosphatase YjhB (NUDIX family)
MTKICDHTSVGMFVWREDKLLLIERMKFPFGFATPAGHVDDDKTFEESAERELMEEVGLKAIKMEIIKEGRVENKCRREGGTWHYWKVYKVEAEGEVKASPDETKQYGWYDREAMTKLGERTQDYLDGKITDAEWEKQPGLETVFYMWLKDFKII